METTYKLRVVNKRVWWKGLANLFHANNTKWWHTRKWIVQTVFWLLFVNGMLAASLWSLPAAEISEAFASLGSMQTLETVNKNQIATILLDFLAMYAIALPVGAIIAGQDSLIGERQAGTAAWVLSKPVSRSAFILSKLAASTLGIWVVGVVIQGVVAYTQLSFRIGSPWPIASFLGVMGLLSLSLFFYITLTTMLGAIFNNRGIVLGISLGVALLGPSMLLSLPVINQITPWTFFIPITKEIPVGLALAYGQPAEMTLPILGTVIFCLVFTAVALVRFQREEF